MCRFTVEHHRRRVCHSSSSPSKGVLTREIVLKQHTINMCFDTDSGDNNVDMKLVYMQRSDDLLTDWGLGELLVCFTSLLDNCQVAEEH